MRLGIFIDGTFIPERDGASTRFANLPEQLAMAGGDVVVFHCYRGWSDLALISKAPFKTYFFPPTVFYKDFDCLTEVVRRSGITMIQMNDVETVSRLGYKLAGTLDLHLVFEAHYHTSSLAAALGASAKRIAFLRRLERDVCRAADHVIAFTDEDRNRWIAISQCPADRVSTIPFGVGAVKAAVSPPAGGLSFLGNMFYEPNRRAVLRLAHEILPIVRRSLPATPASVIGDIPDDLRKVCTAANIQVHGEVAEPAALLASESIGLAPVLEGSGVRVKIFSYVSSGLPVVSTAIGAEGIKFPSVFEEESSDGAAARCVDILKRPGHYASLVAETSRLLQDHHHWSHIARRASGLYQAISKLPRRTCESAPWQCSQAPMWIEEVITKGRFAAQPTAEADFRLGIAGSEKWERFR
jgi:glycosyltransferase involved in cell wall biosynthesis